MITGDKSVEPDMNTILDVLANRYRRRVLMALLEHNPQGDQDPHILDDVIIDTTDLEPLIVAMRHTHLPKLEEAGFIAWDQEQGTVSKGPEFEAIRPVLELLENHTDELPDDWR